jgi:hypothetical protein
MGQRTPGDQRFESYLAERGIDVPEHEPDLGIGVRIEYLLKHEGVSCATEVKEFAPDSWPIKKSGSYSQKTMLKPIRGQIHEAARKLRRARGLGHPLVVVLTDPANAMSGFLTPTEIIASMMGDLQVQIAVSASGPVGPSEFNAGVNGELRHDHPYISAVSVVHARTPTEHVADTYITRSPDAMALSPAFFRGTNDRVFEYDADQGAYVLN